MTIKRQAKNHRVFMVTSVTSSTRLEALLSTLKICKSSSLRCKLTVFNFRYFKLISCDGWMISADNIYAYKQQSCEIYSYNKTLQMEITELVEEKNFRDNFWNIRTKGFKILVLAKKILTKLKSWDCNPHIPPLSRQNTSPH